MTAIVKDIVTDLREKRLWPLAVLLLAALIAVPLALTKSSQPTPVASSPAPEVPPAPGLPVVSAQATPAHSRLTGPSRDPFAGPGLTAAASSSAGGAASSTAAGTLQTSTTGGGSVAGGSANLSGATGGSSAVVTPPTSIITPPVKPTAPLPAALSPTETYDVSLAITNPSGGLDTLDPLERLTVLPSGREPLLVELGVLQGGQRVLFAVMPGSVVDGPGACTPGPIDCEILSLGVDQTESLAQQTGSGQRTVALFAVTSISVVDHSTAAAATTLRRRESAAGRAVLERSGLPALSLFRYQPSLGVVTDLRNLTVGVG